MRQKREIVESEILHKAIINSLKERNAQEIYSIDLRNIEEAIVEKMIVCHGNSNTQVGAMADNLVDDVKKLIQVIPNKVEGKKNNLWIVVDYIDIVVHIFYKECRDFYNLEDLWNDGIIEKY